MPTIVLKYRLYPNKSQKRFLFRALDEARRETNKGIRAGFSAMPDKEEIARLTAITRPSTVPKDQRAAYDEEASVAARKKLSEHQKSVYAAIAERYQDARRERKNRRSRISGETLAGVITGKKNEGRAAVPFKRFFESRKSPKIPVSGNPTYKSRRRFSSIPFPNTQEGCQVGRWDGETWMGFNGVWPGDADKDSVRSGWYHARLAYSQKKADAPLYVRVRVHRVVPGILGGSDVLYDRTSRRWYLCVTCKTPPPGPGGQSGSVGIDLGINSFATLSTGEKWVLPLEEDRVPELQKLQSTKKKGSSRYRKLAREIAKLRRRAADRLAHWHNRLARRLVERYSFIAVEDLAVKRMMSKSGRRRNRKIQRLGWRKFITTLKQKGVAAGVTVKEVNPKDTSRLCPQCGLRDDSMGVDGKGKRMTWDCKCGCREDRDVAAARNILAKSLTNEKSS